MKKHSFEKGKIILNKMKVIERQLNEQRDACKKLENPDPEETEYLAYLGANFECSNNQLIWFLKSIIDASLKELEQLNIEFERL